MSIGQKTYLVLAIGALILVILAVFVFKPLFLEIKTVSALALESREKFLSLEMMDKGYVGRVEREYEEINNRIGEIIKSAFVNKEKAVEFFEALESLASTTGSQIEMNVSDFPIITVNLKGSFPSLMKFLGWLENGPYFISVNSINISRASARGGEEETISGKIRSTIKITVYSYE